MLSQVRQTSASARGMAAAMTSSPKLDHGCAFREPTQFPLQHPNCNVVASTSASASYQSESTLSSACYERYEQEGDCMPLCDILDMDFGMDLLPTMAQTDYVVETHACAGQLEPEPEQLPMQMEGGQLATAQPSELSQQLSPVFGQDSSILDPSAAPTTLNTTGFGARLKKSLSFSSVNQVRTLSDFDVANFFCEFALLAPGMRQSSGTDSQVQMKKHDGPDLATVQMDVLVRAYFRHQPNTVQELQMVLGHNACQAIAAVPPEILADRLRQLGSRLEQGPATGHIGMLPSNSRLGQVHAPGVAQLAAWLWPSNQQQQQPGQKQPQYVEDEDEEACF